MKRFKMTHLIFENDVEEFSEENIPKWLLHKEFNWWYNDYVLELEVGQYIDDDFRRYERVV